MNKKDFILDLLSNKKLLEKDRAKILKLSAKEFEKNEEEFKLLKNEFNKFKLHHENSIDEIWNALNKNIPKREKNKKKHSPKTMVNFLYRFSIDENFKWFTHNSEGLINFNYTQYSKNAALEFDKLTGWDINNKTYYNVKNFISDTGTEKKVESYGSKNIIYSWKDIKKWCVENPNIHPYNAEVNNYKFYKYINQFKHLIEFRTDDPDLTFNIRVRKFIREKLGSDFDPKFDQSFNEIGQSLRLFCDTNLLFIFLKEILGWIQINKAKSLNVEIKMNDFEEYTELEINHLNSYFNMAPDDEKVKGISGEFDKARKLLFCVADWEIYTILKSNETQASYKIICLDRDTELSSENSLSENKIEKINSVLDGVKHVIKFYKNRNL
jgi:hypothetical protein